MFSFAKNLVKTIEQSAESIISTSSNLINTDGDPYFQSAGTSYGFRVLHVDKDSPAASLGLEPWFDYIVGLNNHGLSAQAGGDSSSGSGFQVPDYDMFLREIENCVNRPINLQVWNGKGGILRDVYIENVEAFVSDSARQFNALGYLEDAGNAVINNKFKTLGIAVQATPLITATYVYHILEVQPNSPAEQCGLLPHSDYIIGANDGMFATGGEDLFGRVINSLYSRDPQNCSVDLVVYNHDFDVVRPVLISPNTVWGGQGILGCGVGYGFLHRVPQVVGKFEVSVEEPNYLQAPGQTLFNINSDNTSSEFIPIKVAAAAAHAPPPISKKKKKQTARKQTDFSDYFEEETKKSEKIDGNSRTAVDKDLLPPPPKKVDAQEPPAPHST